MWRVTADNGLPRCQGYRWLRFGLLGSSFGGGLAVSGRGSANYCLIMPNLFILTWNPDIWNMDWVQQSQRMGSGSSGSEKGTWSVGSRRGGIFPGDRLVLLRQARDRGIIASGTATSTAYEDPHWDDQRDKAWYVDLNWEKHVAIKDRLTIEKLKEIAPHTWWTPRCSGTKVRESDASRVWQVWLSHHDDVG